MSDLNHLRCLRAVFLCIEVVPTLKINSVKLEQVPVDQVASVDSFEGKFELQGVTHTNEVFGLPLEVTFKTKAVWDDIFEKIKRWLAR